MGFAQVGPDLQQNKRHLCKESLVWIADKSLEHKLQIISTHLKCNTIAMERWMS